MSQARAIAFVLAQETDRIVEASDGVSRWGISQANHPELTADQIRNMTQGEAAIIIGNQYWTPSHCAEVPDILQTSMLDSAVNQGVLTAIKILQRALYIEDDGRWGPQTSRSVQLASAPTTLAIFMAERVWAYTQDKEWQTDGKGWVKRATLAALNVNGT